MRKNVKKKKNYSIDLIDDIVPEPNRAYPSLARANAQPKDWPPATPGVTPGAILAQSWRNLGAISNPGMFLYSP